MTLFQVGQLRCLDGEISDWHRSGGYVYLKIGGHAVCLPDSPITSVLTNRNVVRVLLREPKDGGGVAKVLAWQRRGQQRVHYQGLRVRAGVLVFAAVVSLIGWLIKSLWLAAPGIALAVLQLLFMARRWRLLRHFNKLAHWAGQEAPVAIPVSPPAEVPKAAVQGPAAVPLDLPLRVQGGRHTPARASNLPAEILEFTHDAIIIWEMDGAGIVYWNRAAERLYGYTREQAYGRVTHELLKTHLAGGVGELESRLARYGVWVGQLSHTCSDGRRVEVEGQLSLMSQEHRPWLVLEVNRDVTDRNRAETERRAIEQQLSRLRSQTVE